MNAFRCVALTVALIGGSALASGKPTCEDRCAEDGRTCLQVCLQKAGQKSAPQCKQMCRDGEMRCSEKCKKQKTK